MTAFLEGLVKSLDFLVTPVTLPSYDEHVILAETIETNQGISQRIKWEETEYLNVLQKTTSQHPLRQLFTKALLLQFEMMATEHIGNFDLLWGSKAGSIWCTQWEAQFDVYVDKCVEFLEEFVSQLNTTTHHLNNDSITVIKDLPNKFKWLMKSPIMGTDHYTIQLDTRLPLLTKIGIQRLTDSLLSVQPAIADVSFNF